jgi:hypothetical protein
VIVDAILTRSQVGETRLTAPVFVAIEDHQQSLKADVAKAGVRAVCGPCRLVEGGVETNYGDLTLEAFWGPSVLVGIEGEQMIGAATLHGAIHLLHSSYAPIPSLLQATERTLLEALR